MESGNSLFNMLNNKRRLNTVNLPVVWIPIPAVSDNVKTCSWILQDEIELDDQFWIETNQLQFEKLKQNKPPLFEKEQPIEELCVEADEHVHWSSKTLESKC